MSFRKPGAESLIFCPPHPSLSPHTPPALSLGLFLASSLSLSACLSLSFTPASVRGPCLSLLQIPRYILTLHELLAHTPHEHVERNSLDYAKSKLEELSR